MPTIPELIRAAVAANRESVAVVDGDRTATFGEVGERTARLANALNGLSAAEGGRVAILMRNRLEYVEADLAIARAGRVKVPINPKLSDDERAFVIDDSEADIVLTESSELDRVLDTVAGRKVEVVCVDGPATGAHGYDDVIAAASAFEPVLKPDAERLSQFLYTSGTTGRPKGAMLLDRCRVSATTMSLVEEFAVTPRDGMIHAGPLSHGSASKLLTFFVRGARNIVIPKFEPEIFLKAVREQGGTSSFVVPTMIQMLVEHARTDPTTTAWGLRNLTYGGASISRQTLDAAAEVLGGVLTQVYGSCEAPHPVLALRHREESDPSLSEHAVIPAGRPALGVDVRVVGTDGSDAASDDAGVRTGELWVRGPNVMAGYWRRPEATEESIVDGWYRTGDVVTADGDGLYTLVDRVKDIVITGGLNVYPAEVERVLRELPGVAEAAVVGVPDEKWGELVTAVVVPKSPGAVTEEAVISWVADRLAGYKKPRKVLLADDLPKGSTGKILKREVRDLAAKR
ncbi:AMP-binding protein [Actinomadura sp. LD22]|uniref:AMP-binding protein n=1 Tax=Actinomadura physcomitrii TaxID=2650748 RepID=A0A6I4MUL2_9ACTN|nr:AMP-binding protein [Actinomadura physcomitrii]MWA07001.1 AMP-binding protein [Actinomadura physcomitrii]